MLFTGRKSPQIAPYHGVIRTPSNMWLLGPAAPHLPNAISIGLAVFAGYIPVSYKETDTQTDHATTCVAIARIYVLCICDAA